jgi:hypothetical protein
MWSAQRCLIFCMWRYIRTKLTLTSSNINFPIIYMHCFEDLQFKFEICREIQNKDENTWNIENNYEKNTKNGNQTLTNVPLAMKKAQPKNQKKLLLCREPGGALSKGTYAEGGPSAQTCALTTAPAGSRQRPVNRGNPWSMPLPRAGPRPSAQVAFVPTASRSGRRPR